MILGYICTNYNNSSYTISAINSLIDEENINNIVTVIVDNNSDDENRKLLETEYEHCSNVHIIFNHKNIGYFKGLNCGIDFFKNNYDNINHIVIGNNDIVFSNNFYKSILNNKNIFQKYAVISPDITTLNGTHQNPHVIKSISLFREFIYDIYYSNYYIARIIYIIAKITHKFTDRLDEKQHEIAQEIWQGHGSCYILGPLFFKNFDELWAPTFLMGEEFFLSVQLMEKNLMVYYEPSIKVMHHCNASLGNIPKEQAWQFSRDAHKIYRKYVKIWK